MKRTAVLLILILNLSISLAQHQSQNKIDSIKQTLTNLDDKKIIAQTYNSIGVSYMHTNTDSAIHYLLKSVKLGSEIGNLSISGKSFNDLSFLHRERGNYDSALYYSNKSLAIVEQQQDPLSKAKINYSIALIFKTKGRYDTAHSLLKQNLQILKNIQNERGLAVTYNALGQLAEHISDYPKAVDYYYNALNIYNKIEDPAGAAIIYNNLGIVYESTEQNDEALRCYNLYYQYNNEVGDRYRMAIGLKNGGIILEKIGKPDSAIFNFQKAFEIDSAMDAKESMSYDLLGLGSAYIAKKDFFSASRCYHNTLKLSNDPIVTVPAMIGLGKVHLENNLQDSAFQYLETALYKSLSMGLASNTRDAQRLLYELYKKIGNTQKALMHFQNYIEIKDSLYDSKNVQKMANLKAESEFEEEKRKQEALKQAEIDNANYIRNIFIVGMLLSAIIAFLVYLIYKRNKSAKEKLNDLYETVKKQAAELKDLDQIKSNFYTNISHELRTPLTLISGPTEYLLTKHYQNNSEVKSHLELINKHTKHLKVLVDDILDLSKLESQKSNNISSRVKTLSFTRRVFANFESLAVDLNLKYRLVLEGISDEHIILTDSSKLEKILNNLLSNAFKYTNSGGEIILRLSQNEECVTFEVKDNGAGIEKEDIPFIFDKYFQSKQRQTTLQAGSGIGLALSKALSNEIKGNLSVTSKQGIGSSFVLTIPNKSSNGPGEPVASENEVVENQELNYSASDEMLSIQNASTILLVEDHHEMQVFVRGLLKPSGKILVASNGKEALKILSNEHVDLIISDVMMPEMDGHELLKAVRNMESIADIPFIMLTALKSERNLLKALSIGVDDYLIKPFSPQELIARVNNMLVRHAQRKMFATEELEDTEDDQHAYSSYLTPKDQQLVEEMEHILLSNLENEDFTLQELGDIFCISYRQLERNIKSITGLTPKQFQQEVALQQARKLLEEKTYGNPTAIAYSVGIRHVTRFSKLYEKRFGKKPIDYFN